MSRIRLCPVVTKILQPSPKVCIHSELLTRSDQLNHPDLDITISSRSPCSVSFSPSSSSSRSNERNNFVPQQTGDLASSTQVSVPNSQTPTPHPLSQAASPSQRISKEVEPTTMSAISFAPFDSKPATPSLAQPRAGANPGSRVSSESSSLADFPEPMIEEFKGESRSFADLSCSQDEGNTVRTPNVYINGLPPHFPDESLYLMTRDFGHVLSVRTFTRCVGEKMSGYGFVL